MSHLTDYNMPCFGYYNPNPKSLCHQMVRGISIPCAFEMFHFSVVCACVCVFKYCVCVCVWGDVCVLSMCACTHHVKLTPPAVVEHMEIHMVCGVTWFVQYVCVCVCVCVFC